MRRVQHQGYPETETETEMQNTAVFFFDESPARPGPERQRVELSMKKNYI
jgi:hypothetical protein